MDPVAGPALSGAASPSTVPPPSFMSPTAPLIWQLSVVVVALTVALSVVTRGTGVRALPIPVTLTPATPHDGRLRISTGPATLGTPTVPFDLPEEKECHKSERAACDRENESENEIFINRELQYNK